MATLQRVEYLPGVSKPKARIDYNKIDEVRRKYLRLDLLKIAGKGEAHA